MQHDDEYDDPADDGVREDLAGMLNLEVMYSEAFEQFVAEDTGVASGAGAGPASSSSSPAASPAAAS
eukprot:9074586-Alexandrium_andersonii.AAC.1